MKINKYVKLIILLLITVLLLITIFVFEYFSITVGNTITSLFLGIVLPVLWESIQDITDTSSWEMSQRKLERGKIINSKTIIRISFAYLFRIKIGDKYLLVKNERGTDKYQPVGGVYKFDESEKSELKNLFFVKDDDKLPLDKSSRNDYRLRLVNKNLRGFIKRFDNEASREKVNNLSREFKEELIDKDIINWSEISYRFCGRHITNLRFNEHFQIYEILLADVVELLPTVQQEEDLQLLINKDSDLFRWFNASEITSLGINTATNQFKEIIADHSKKILQENEDDLISISNVGKTYTVRISNE